MPIRKHGAKRQLKNNLASIPIHSVAVFNIVSNTHETSSGLKQLYDFLIDFKNFKSILPEDKIQDFKYNEQECSFAINGVTSLTIKRMEEVPYESILFSSEGIAKFNFHLKVFFIGNSILPGKCRIELSGDVNPFIKAMAEKPLTSLVNTMSQKLAELILI